jgi:hypothetical protein
MCFFHYSIIKAALEYSSLPLRLGEGQDGVEGREYYNKDFLFSIMFFNI